eukprot:TRINITY_DN61045_c0_g1_i1.p1 TRINITY_DN61045_c0_g1~~TRINITY_DN61045_c0_g1_i1.p1  ORF type:complete len:627 (+),score=107.93 TRINITY_DN61045_c0_g1_i1:39-1919(+)
MSTFARLAALTVLIALNFEDSCQRCKAEAAKETMLLQLRQTGKRSLVMDEGEKDEHQDLGEPETPVWPSSVHVFDENSPDLAQKIQNLASEMVPISKGKFSSQRTALLFKPGVYKIDVPVGYYTQVVGLGKTPNDVKFVGERGIYGPSEGDNNNFNTFWKSVENVLNDPTSGHTAWSVSQAAPLRRMVIQGDLLLGEYNKSAPNKVSKGSGGFIANVEVRGKLDFMLQQQWMVRNCKVEDTIYFKEQPRAANFVFVGTPGAPAQTPSCTNASYNPVNPSPQQLVVNKAPLRMEKPFIVIDEKGKYSLVTPELRTDSEDVDFGSARNTSFKNVFVATNDTSVRDINSKLDAGLHVILTPGIYKLTEPIRIGWSKMVNYQVLLGLGWATLIPTAGLPAVEVGPAEGIRVAGLMLQAGATKSTQLLYWTPSAGSATSPGLLADVFARVGGPDTEVVSADVMFQVDGSNVILDNVWAWRADCCQNGCGTCEKRYCDHGVVINGDRVTSYGLFSEHCQKELTVWNGEAGQSYFYQSEMDSFAREHWDNTSDYGENGVSGYLVTAKNHTAMGIGVYAYFTQAGNKVQAGTVVTRSEALGTIKCPFKWDLNPTWYNKSESGIALAMGYRPRPP